MKTSFALSKNARSRCASNSGSAIVITLSILALVTILSVGLFSVLMTERTTSSSAFEIARARALNQVAADHAISLIRTATSGTTGAFWSSQPGAITVFDKYGTVSRTVYLSSTSATTSGSVDLNQPSFSGNYPIASLNSLSSGTGNKAATPPTTAKMFVNWVNVPSDPTAQTSATNQITGRYAFWVDDESAKLNINTADGSLKGTAATGLVPQASFGPGTPAEMSLGALRFKGASGLKYIDDPVNGIAGLTGAIAQRTGMRPVVGTVTSGTLFNDPSEIQQQPNAPGTLYEDNKFSITTYNRAPELNIFGEPKIYVMTSGTNLTGTPVPLNTLLGPYAYDGTATFPNPVLSGTPATQSTGTPYGGTGGTNAPASSISDYVNGGFIGGSVSGTLAPLTEIYPPTSTQAWLTTNLGKGQLPTFTARPPLGSSVTSPISGALPQYFTDSTDYFSTASTSFNPLLYRVAQYLTGTNSQGQKITWPTFPGSDTTGVGFAGKYTPRQLDSILLQMENLVSGVWADHARMHADQTVRNAGCFVSGTAAGLVVGQNNLCHVNQVVLRIQTTKGTTTTSGTTTTTSPDSINIAIYVQWYMPKEYIMQNDMVGPYGSTAWDYGAGGNQGQWLNWQDVPQLDQKPTLPLATTYKSGKVGSLGSLWQDTLLTVKDGSGHSVLDLFGNDPTQDDPDQAKAQYCQHAQHVTTSGTTYYGSGLSGASTAYCNALPILAMSGGMLINSLAGSGTNGLREGYYVCSRNSSYNLFYNMMPGLSGTTVTTSSTTSGINISGGLTIMVHNESSGFPTVEVVPLDSVHGYINCTGTGTGTGGVAEGGHGLSSYCTFQDFEHNGPANSLSNAVQIQRVKDAVIPISPDGNPVNIPVPCAAKYIVMWVDDPVVNKFPGDWHVKVSDNTPPPEATLKMNATSYPCAYRTASTLNPSPYTKGLAPGASDDLYSADGPPLGFLSSNKGDPSGYWWPQQSVQIPKSQRFPSVGYFQYIHTGIMPDKGTEAAAGTYPDGTPYLPKLHGTPFRLFNFSPSGDASQQTDGGINYPDWAMLDLFTVPATFQPMDPTPGNALSVANCAPPIQLTWGGATTGRLNPNSPILCSGSTVLPFSRITPLVGILKNLSVSNAYYTGNNQQFQNFTSLVQIGGNPISDPAALAAAINYYIANTVKRPLMMAGEICNVPAVANFLYDSNRGGTYASDGSSRYWSKSRNDLVKQIVGNLSPRSNTFTVWAVAQTVKQKNSADRQLKDTTYSQVLPTDTILSESRMKFLVERYLDYGAVGVPGNIVSPGTDGVVGTPDDPVDPTYHPGMSYPLKYRYRILSASPVTN